MEIQSLMEGSIVVRPLDNHYCQPVIDLILQIQQIEFKLPVTLEGQADLFDIERNYHGTGGGFWGAFYQNELIGTIALISTGHRAGALRKMFVKKAFRGKQTGVAQQLLQTLLEFCSARGIRDLYLGTIHVLKAAHRFYERNGFQRVSRADLPSYFPAMMWEDVYYYLSLTKPAMNVIDEAGVLAISTRLQRLSDLIRKDGLQIYKAHGIDFEPKWFPVIYALHKKPVLSVVEVAAEIGYTHPSTIALLKELEKQKLIRSKKDKADERKRLIQLSKKGQALVEQMKPVWRLIIAAVTDLIDTENNLMRAVSEVEDQLKKKSFTERAVALMENPEERTI